MESPQVNDFMVQLANSIMHHQLLGSLHSIYASVLLGTVFGLLSMVAAIAVVVPAVLVTWMAVVVFLAFFGKPKRTLVVERRKITREIFSFVIKVLLKERNVVVAAVCTVLGYLLWGEPMVNVLIELGA
ncbi:hypothetical protein RJT34_28926 [Clitoria ternatea]|uniref:Uncharacterized protein n=1 Tax=Clitoria ternatea TaxID=43366 RepID=A0AAN9IH92_CLITE